MKSIEDIILEYIKEQFGEKSSMIGKHYSYCRFPEDDCTCKFIDNNITYDTPLINGGYVDSFSMVVVLLFLEDTFNIKIADNDTMPANFNTVNIMKDLVLKYLKI